MFKEAHIDALENLSAEFLHSFIATVLNDDIDRNRVSMVIQLLNKKIVKVQ
jgi:hypothetical protein